MTTQSFYVGIDEYRTRAPGLSDLLEKVLTIDTSGSTPKLVFKIGNNIIDVVANLEAALKDEVATDGDTLYKLRSLITDLNTSLTSEATRLDGRIDSVISNLDPAAIDSLTELLATLNAGDGDLADAIAALGTSTNSAIGTETTRAQDAEAAIASDLTDEIDRATSAESTLQQNINDEAGSRVSGDNTLQDNINSLDTWTVGQVDDLNAAISNEVTARQNAITTEVTDRDAAILVETNRAQDAEAALSSDISDLQANLSLTAQDGITLSTNVAGGKDISVNVDDIIDGDIIVKNANGDITLAEYIAPRVI